MSREARPVEPAAYLRLFEQHAEGARVLEDLVSRFGGNPYVRGGLEGDRETCYRAGQNRVVNFILGRINAAHGVQSTDEGDDDAR